MMSTRSEYCRRCGSKLNPYGVCPNVESHRRVDETVYGRSGEDENDKEKSRAHFQKLLDCIFSGEPLPIIPTKPHDCDV